MARTIRRLLCTAAALAAWQVASNAAGSRSAASLDRTAGQEPIPTEFTVRPHDDASEESGGDPVADPATDVKENHTASTSACLVITCDEAGGHPASPLNGASFDDCTIPEWTKSADDSHQLAVHFVDRAVCLRVIAHELRESAARWART